MRNTLHFGFGALYMLLQFDCKTSQRESQSLQDLLSFDARQRTFLFRPVRNLLNSYLRVTAVLYTETGRIGIEKMTAKIRVLLYGLYPYYGRGRTVYGRGLSSAHDRTASGAKDWLAVECRPILQLREYHREHSSDWPKDRKVRRHQIQRIRAGNAHVNRVAENALALENLTSDQDRTHEAHEVHDDARRAVLGGGRHLE
ncbi:hypothetical protein DFH11DRAFT_1544724 [Phellopilus nigrolimitatus]|nr:hypothetical protein DFH11DRAFT_1544724 [Phellopilus nigrolimitatus]